MAASVAVMLATALIYPKRDYEEDKVHDLRIDLENKLVSMEEVVNEVFQIDLGIGDKISGTKIESNIPATGQFPDISLDKDILMRRIKNGGGIGFGVIPEGKISLDAKAKRLEVTVGKTDRNLYLKGYIADVYKDGRWVYSGNVSNDVTYATEFMEGKEHLGFYASRQKINVANVGDKSQVDFIPYFMKESAYDFQYSPQGGVVSKYSKHGYYTRYDTSLDDITLPSFNFKGSDWEILSMSEEVLVSDEE